MAQFILATFALLAIAFWVVSGGSSFEPEARPEPIEIAASEPTPEPEAAPEPEAPTPAPQPEPVNAVAAAAATAAAPEPTPEPEPAPAPAPQPEPAVQVLSDFRSVTASRVNMRSGPSTDYRVLSTLTQGTQVEVLEIDDLGSEPWARLMVLNTGLEGWMATRFLTDQ